MGRFLISLLMLDINTMHPTVYQINTNEHLDLLSSFLSHLLNLQGVHIGAKHTLLIEYNNKKGV